MIDERRIRLWRELPTLTVAEAALVSGIPARKLYDYLADGTLERATLPRYRKLLVRTASLVRLLDPSATPAAAPVRLTPENERRLRAQFARTG